MEVALWVKDKTAMLNVGKENEAVYRKKRGSVVVAVPDNRIRRKWVEICGDLMSPTRRHLFPHMRKRDEIIEAWNENWLRSWEALKNDDITATQAWGEIVAEGLPDLGKDPNGEVPLTDSWGWSQHERRIFCLGKIESEDAKIAKKINYMRNNVRTAGFANVIDYRTRLGLSEEQIADIEDPLTVVNPSLSKPWPSNSLAMVCNFSDIIEDENIIPEGQDGPDVTIM